MSGTTSLLSRWSTSISIQTLSSTTTNQYGEYTYNAATNIQGRLIQTEEEINSFREGGSKILADAKLFTEEDLDINTKVGSYLVISKKSCKDKDNNIAFYKYYLCRKHQS